MAPQKSRTRKNRRHLFIWAISIWIAWLLRLPGLFANTFHADEALFATWARLIAVWQDPLLVSQAVDKPPLLFYIQALFYPLFGPETWAARMPALIASLLLIPLIGCAVWLVYRQVEVVVITVWLLTFSPLAIQFSPTAFTDPLLLCLLSASFCLAAPVRGRSTGRSGLFWGLALATKYQALLFLPLILGAGIIRRWRIEMWQRFLSGALFPILLIIFWDFARTGEISLWQSQFENFGGLRWSFSWELLPRLRAWGELLLLVYPWPLLLCAIILIITRLLPIAVGRENRGDKWDLLFAFFLIAYLGFHNLAAVPVWDRYLLLLLPVLTILIARGLWLFLAFLPGRHAPIVTLIILVLLLSGDGLRAREGLFPVGGSPSADRGAAEVAAVLADAPYGSVLYDHWFSWQWRYHLFDKRVYVSWFADPRALEADLKVFGRDGNRRYIALPADETAAPLRRVISRAGYSLSLVQSAGDILLYALSPE